MPTPDQIDDWSEFLSDNGCKGVVDFGDWVMCHCPFHEQTDFVRPSFGINKESGWGNCFGCGKKSWEDICSAFGIAASDFIEGVRTRAWERFVKKLHGVNKSTYLRFKLPSQLHNPMGHSGSASYLNSRGIAKEVLERMGVRLCLDKASKYFEHLIFPISDEKGVLYFDARYIGSREGVVRWRAPMGSARDRTFFNWKYGVKVPYLCLVEGASDAVKMMSMGIENTIPAKYYSDKQFSMILKSGAKFLFLAHDEDAAGRYVLNKKGENISFMNKAKILFSGAGMYINEVKFPQGCKDPGDIKSEEELWDLNPTLHKTVKEFHSV